MTLGVRTQESQGRAGWVRVGFSIHWESRSHVKATSLLDRQEREREEREREKKFGHSLPGADYLSTMHPQIHLNDWRAQLEPADFVVQGERNLGLYMCPTSGRPSRGDCPLLLICLYGVGSIVHVQFETWRTCLPLPFWSSVPEVFGHCRSRS